MGEKGSEHLSALNFPHNIHHCTSYHFISFLSCFMSVDTVFPSKCLRVSLSFCLSLATSFSQFWVAPPSDPWWHDTSLKNMKSFENPGIMADKSIYSQELFLRTEGSIWTEIVGNLFRSINSSLSILQFERSVRHGVYISCIHLYHLLLAIILQ